MPEIALAEEPLNVAIGYGANPCAAQRWALVPVALRIGLVALLAMVAVDKRAGRNRLRIAGQRVGAGVIPDGNMLPSGVPAAATVSVALSTMARIAKFRSIIDHLPGNRRVPARYGTSRQPVQIQRPGPHGRSGRGLSR